MSPEQKRNAIANAYPGAGWALKVQKMTDQQVHVVYMRLMNAGKVMQARSTNQIKTHTLEGVK